MCIYGNKHIFIVIVIVIVSSLFHTKGKWAGFRTTINFGIYFHEIINAVDLCKNDSAGHDLVFNSPCKDYECEKYWLI